MPRNSEWREDNLKRKIDHMAQSAASDLFSMFTPFPAFPDAHASAPSTASDGRPLADTGRRRVAQALGEAGVKPGRCSPYVCADTMIL